jgi:hypothetical protein
MFPKNSIFILPNLFLNVNVGELFLNGCITAPLPANHLSRPLWRPQIFTAIQFLKTATFEESGRDGGHLATLLMDLIWGVCSNLLTLQGQTKTPPLAHKVKCNKFRSQAEGVSNNIITKIIIHLR